MAVQQKFVQMQPTTLGGAGSSLGDTTLILSSFLDIKGVPLAMTDFGNLGFGTIEPSGVNEEQISFTGITQNGNGTATLTGVKTVLFKYPYTQTSGMANSHPGGATFVISNTAGFYNELASTANDQTISGLWTFSTLPQSSGDPTLPLEFADKHYVDNVVITGAPNATTSVQGLVQLPTQAQIDAKTGSGSTGAALSVTPNLVRATKYNDYVTDTGSASTYVIAPSPAIVAYATGQQFTFIAATANSASSGVSTIAVSGLAAKSIKKLFNAALVVNDILAGQVVTVVYDGTNFQMINPVGRNFVDLTNSQTIASGVKTFTVLPQSSTAPSTGDDLVNKTYVDANPITYTSGNDTKDTAGASTTQNIAHGLGRIPRRVKLRFHSSLGTTLQEAYSDVSYNGTTITVNGLSGDGTTSLSLITSNSVIVLNDINTGTRFQTGTLTFDATNIIIAWVKTNTPVRVYSIFWEAE